jgi:hypothetical protein
VFVFVLMTLQLSAYAVHAASHVTVPYGTSWDGPANELQHVVDGYLGVSGALDVHTGFVGAHPGELDPWFWVGSSIPALMVTEIAANRDFNVLGWYRETGSKPAIDGVDDGVVFTGGTGSGASVVVTFPTGLTKFGFYLDTQHVVTTPGGSREQLFFTNRFYNDTGPSGFAATHAPFDGDVQAVVFDVSPWKGADTWLLCFEDRDSGLPLTACCDGTDNDYNDLVFQVRALGATPAQTVSFGMLKSRYR